MQLIESISQNSSVTQASTGMLTVEMPCFSCGLTRPDNDLPLS